MSPGGRRLPLELRLLTGLTLAVAVVYATTPVAIRVANRFEFYDHPVGYKAHGTPTPYLGGAAVVAGFVIAVGLLSRDWERTVPLIGGTLLMWGVGTWDDRRTVTPLTRVFVEVAIAALIWQLGYGWELGLGTGIDLVATCAWVVAVVNAFNLFDNMDGATSSMGTVTAAGLSLLGIVQGNTWLAVAGAALCGACAGFLPHNLRSPARIFLGDGGSMPIGFAVATLTMIGVSESAVELQSLAMGLLFVGIPALDTTLVMISRRRRGIPLLTGGRDHLTHRTRVRVRTARAVAIALGGAQAIISILAIVALHRGASAIAGAVAIYIVAAGVAIAVLDTRWAAAEAPVVSPTGQVSGATKRIRRRRTSMALVALAPLLAVAAAAPFFEGYYHPRLWIPGALVLVVLLTAGLIAAPVRLTRPALLFLGGVAALMALSLVSAVWADSIEAAVTEANRLALYLVLTGLLLVVLRTDAAAAWLVGGLAAAIAAGGAVVIAWMLGSDPTRLFIGGRLDEPLGYINGQAAFLLLGAWCCLAVAEQRRSSPLAGMGMAGATMLAALVMLSQSRGVALAAIASIVMVLAVVPGRLRRIAGLAVLGAALALAGAPLLDVYQGGRSGSLGPDVVREAARAALIAAALSGLAWAGMTVLQRQGASVTARGRPFVIAGLVACALVVGGIAVAERGAIADSVERQYREFTRVGEQGPTAAASASRLASGSGNRFDYWRIAWRTFEDRPLLGVGAGNYDRPYFQQRATEEDVTQPHSIELQVLSELGTPGLVALLLALAGLVWGGWGLARAARGSEPARFLAVAGIGCVTAWLVHTSVDWLHLLPGVSGVGLAGAVLLLRDRMPTRAPSPVRAIPRHRLAPAALAAIALALLGASLSREWIAETLRTDAQEALAERPEEALRQADRALRLDPEATEAYFVKSAALARFGQAEAAEAALREAARREPRNYVTWALLGDLAVRTGELAEARRHYRRALRLNPRDPGLRAHLADPRGRIADPGG